MRQTQHQVEKIKASHSPAPRSIAPTELGGVCLVNNDGRLA
jgi:hypothetical protein